MKSSPKTNLVLASIALAAVCLSCTFLKGGSGNSPYGIGDIHKAPLPSFDGDESFPAMSTDAINALVAELPELAKYRDQILEAERAAVNGILADIRAKPRTNNVGAVDSSLRFNSSPFDSAVDNFSAHINLIPAAYAADDPPAIPDMGGVEYFLIGHHAGFLTPDYEKVRDTDLGRSKTEKIKSDTTGEVIATTTLTVGTDGRVTSEISTNINMPVMGLNANSKVKIQGNQCPTSAGEIDLTIELSTNGRVGGSGSMIYDKTITAKLKATVNDNAEIAAMDLDLKQAQRSTPGGRQVYVETSQTGRTANGTYSGFEYGDVRVDRTSSQVKTADAEMSQTGLRAAFYLAEGLLENAKERWQSGGCVQIIADSPDTVAVSSTTQIAVKVTHKIDRSEVPSKLEAVLSGESSVDPKLIERTAGAISYVAPGEHGKKASIGLTAKSKRGIAKLDLMANTGGTAYRVNGSSGGASFKGEICDLNKPFVITMVTQWATWPLNFTPASESGGQMEGHITSQGITVTGGGPYTVKFDSNGAGTIEWSYNTSNSSLGKTYNRTVTESLPLIPSPDLSCN